MADIELVIKIPKRAYNYIRKYEHIANSDILDIKDAIINSTPLPKGHGRLIDADVIGEKLNRYTEAPYQYALVVFNESPTIIEADKESDKE